jgi:hypothetical protein
LWESRTVSKLPVERLTFEIYIEDVLIVVQTFHGKNLLDLSTVWTTWSCVYLKVHSKKNKKGDRSPLG